MNKEQRILFLYKHAQKGHTKQLENHISELKLTEQELLINCFGDALIMAAQNGHIECVQMLLPLTNFKPRKTHALIKAAEHGHAECVKLLIPVSDPLAFESNALSNAAKNGHTQCVQALLSCGHLQKDISYALYEAVRNGHADVFDALYPLSDIQWIKDLITSNDLQYTDGTKEQQLLFIDTCIARYQKALMNEHTQSSAASRPLKKM